MKKTFKILMREQVEEMLNNFDVIKSAPAPKDGWIKTMRQVLGMSISQLAQRLGCTQANVSALEQREKKGGITIEKLEEAAKVMNCRFVYVFVPNKPIDKILENQALITAKKRLSGVEHSMELEDQGLSPAQKKEQLRILVDELLQGNPKKLWED